MVLCYYWVGSVFTRGDVNLFGEDVFMKVWVVLADLDGTVHSTCDTVEGVFISKDDAEMWAEQLKERQYAYSMRIVESTLDE